MPIRACNFRRLMSSKLISFSPPKSPPSLRRRCLQPSSWELAGDPEMARRGEQEGVAGRPPADVPKGFLAVYVGQERRRYVIEAHYLNHSLFKALLERSAEEYGFCHKGGLRIPCEVVLFEHLLWLLDYDDPAARRLEYLDELLNFYSSP